jgi:beta-N-acetylhexosaminidase
MENNQLREKIGQLMVFGFQGTTASPEIKKLIREHHVGGIILFGRNIGSPEEVLKLTTELQLEAKKAGHEQPLLICIDQENGVVRRLGQGTTVFPGAMLMGATGNPANAYMIGAASARELKALGINWNLAPVVDVNNNPDNPVIGVRSFGEDVDSVTRFAMESMKGMQDAGIITTLKHFPGHGDTAVDSHLDLPVISHDIDRLNEVELVPFKTCIDQGADTIMSAHVYFPAIEPAENVPATLSEKVITGLLRETLGFDGVVTTDCMEMNAISETVGTAQGGVEAIKAGIDLVMVSHLHTRHLETLNAVEEAVKDGYISMDTIDQAYGRVMKLKKKYLDWSDINTDLPSVNVPQLVGSKKHEFEAKEVYRQGVTLAGNKEGYLPVPVSNDHSVLVVSIDNSSVMQVEDKKYSTFKLGEAVQEFQPEAVVKPLSNPPTEQEQEDLLQIAGNFNTIIAGTLSASQDEKQADLIHKLLQVNENVVVVATRSPYDLAYFPEVKASIAAYEFTYPALTTAAAAIFGRVSVKGKLPVTLPKLVKER